MEAELFIPIIAIGALFIILPWIVFHYITKWKAQATLTKEDEDLLDELHELARRLDERMCTIERIVQAENPNWQQIVCDPAESPLSTAALIDERDERILESVGRSNRPAARSTTRSTSRSTSRRKK